MIEVSAVRMARSRRVCGSDAVWVRDGSRRVSKAPEPVGREAIGNRVRVRSASETDAEGRPADKQWQTSEGGSDDGGGGGEQVPCSRQFQVGVWSVGAEHWWQWWRYGRCGWRVRVVDTDKPRGARGEVGMLVAWAVRKEECKRL